MKMREGEGDARSKLERWRREGIISILPQPVQPRWGTKKPKKTKGKTKSTKQKMRMCGGEDAEAQMMKRAMMSMRPFGDGGGGGDDETR